MLVYKMVQFASYLGRVLCKTRLIFPRINGPNISLFRQAFHRKQPVPLAEEVGVTDR